MQLRILLQFDVPPVHLCFQVVAGALQLYRRLNDASTTAVEHSQRIAKDVGKVLETCTVSDVSDVLEW